MKKMRKKNNKGFSLVELIVVVLIMGIIAVALAPQIMKWVQTSRENTDKNQIATIKATAQTAVAEWMEKNTAPQGDYEIGALTGTDETTFAGLLKLRLGEEPTPANGGKFYVHVSSTGVVTVDKTAGAGAPATP